MVAEYKAGAYSSSPRLGDPMQRTDSLLTKRWLWICIILLVGLPIYFVRELLACLLLFSVLFLLGTVGFAVTAFVAAGVARLFSFSFPGSTPLGAASDAHSIKDPSKFLLQAGDALRRLRTACLRLERSQRASLAALLERITFLRVALKRSASL